MFKQGIVLAVFISAVYSAKFPSNWLKCPKTGNEECLKKAFVDAVVDMKNGKKEVNVIPLDPLHFTKIVMNQGGKSPVNINLTFYDLDLVGSSRSQVSAINADWDNYLVEIDIDVINGPAMLLGDYAMSGKVLLLPIQGKGKANITLDNFSVLLRLKGSELIKNNKKYFKVDVGQFIIKSNKVHFWFGNLFDGVPNLGENMNIFLNENWVEIMNELNGTISNALGLGIKEVANNFFMKVPLSELYT